MKKGVFLIVVSVIILSLMGVSVGASFDPATISDDIVYRNLFGDGRNDNYPEEEFPLPVYVNGGARGGNSVEHASEANWNGAIFLFENAVFAGNANEVLIFFAADMNHGGVMSADYYVYAVEPGTEASEAINNSNRIATLIFDRGYLETASWDNFYESENEGPLSASVSLDAGTYDIYVEVDILDAFDSYEWDTDSISPKLSDIVFTFDSDKPEPTATPENTEAPTQAPTEDPGEQPTEQPGEQPTDKPTGTDSEQDNTTIFVVIGVLIVAAGATVVIIKKKKSQA